MLSIKQRGTFWIKFAETVAVLGYKTKEDKDSYHNKILREECGVEHLKDLNRGEDFNRVMSRLAADAHDFQGAAYWGIADGRRMAAMIEDCLAQAFEDKGREADPVAYVLGILRQSKIGQGRMRQHDEGLYWIDLTLIEMRRIFQIVNTFRRRSDPHAYKFGNKPFFVNGVHIAIKPVAA